MCFGIRYTNRQLITDMLNMKMKSSRIIIYSQHNWKANRGDWKASLLHEDGFRLSFSFLIGEIISPSVADRVSFRIENVLGQRFFAEIIDG
ncbi:hypothetical protein D3C78_1387050 [compost metagenome]